jgi:hypothetical protein
MVFSNVEQIRPFKTAGLVPPERGSEPPKTTVL